MSRLIGYIALGGALGSVARFALGSYVQQRATTSLPVGTLAVNIVGSFTAGFLLSYALRSTSISPDARAFAVTGFCGGFTTFSAFSYETVALLQDGDYRRATMYVVLSLVLSMTAALAGVAAGSAVAAARH